jgi:hypothetical protein
MKSAPGSFSVRFLVQLYHGYQVFIPLIIYGLRPTFVTKIRMQKILVICLLYWNPITLVFIWKVLRQAFGWYHYFSDPSTFGWVMSRFEIFSKYLQSLKSQSIKSMLITCPVMLRGILSVLALHTFHDWLFFFLPDCVAVGIRQELSNSTKFSLWLTEAPFPIWQHFYSSSLNKYVLTTVCREQTSPLFP